MTTRQRTGALSANAWAVLTYIREHPGCGTRDLMDALSLPYGVVCGLTTTLTGRSLIGMQQHFPENASAYFIRYFPEIA